jgi:peptide deformylase
MAKILPIKIDPDPVLRKISAPLDQNKIALAEIQELCRDMAETMEKKDGIGLAAPQIGKNIRIIVVNSPHGVLCMINPRITKRSFAKEWSEEGCLSVPETFGQVRRHKKINCIYHDRQGKVNKVQLKDLMARVVQHEIDHLDGILFTDKAKNIKKAEQ